MALSTIQLCLSNEVLREVVKETTTKGMREKLESLYMAKSVTNRLLLKSRLYDLPLGEGKPLKPHLDEIYSLVMDSLFTFYVLYLHLTRILEKLYFMVEKT